MKTFIIQTNAKGDTCFVPADGFEITPSGALQFRTGMENTFALNVNGWVGCSDANSYTAAQTLKLASQALAETAPTPPDGSDGPYEPTEA